MHLRQRITALAIGSCIIVGWLVIGKPQIPWIGFPPGPPLAEAGDGDIGIFREATGGDTISTTVTDIDWDTTVQSDSAFALQANNIDIDLADAGHYLVMYSVVTDDSSGGSSRTETQSWLRLNDTTNLAYGRGQSYIRRSGNADEGYNEGAAIIDVAANDNIRLQMQRTDNSSETVERRANASGIQFLKLHDSWDYLRTRPTSNQSFGSDENFTDVALGTDDEIDSGSFSRTGGAITLKQGGHYLVTYNVGIVHNNNRVNDEVRLVIDNGTPIEIPGTRVTTYMRGIEGTFDGMATWAGIIFVTADDVLKLQVRRESDSQPGTHEIKAAESGITIAKLPEGADFVRLGEASGGQDLSTSRTAITWDSTKEEDSDSFEHDNTNTSRINIEANDDYLFFHSLYADRASQSDGTRETQLFEWRTNGSTLLQYGTSGQYNRGDQGGTDAFTSGSSGGIIMPGLSDADYVELTQINEAGNGTSTYQADHMGLQGVNISSLFITSFPVTKQLHFRWRDDTRVLNTNGGWRTTEDTNTLGVIPDLSEVYRLRLAVANTGTASEAAARTYELQYGRKETICSAIADWTGVGDGSAFTMTATPQMSEGQATTSGLLANAEAYTRISGEGRESADTTGSLGPLAVDTFAELEYSISADSGVSFGDTYCFRVYDTTADAAIDVYSEFPELTMGFEEIRQKHFRWRNDSTDLNSDGGWLAAEDVNGAGAIEVDDVLRLRLYVANEGNKTEAAPKTYELQYTEKNGSCAASGGWAGIGNASDAFEMRTTTHIDPDGQATTSGLFTNGEDYTRINGEGREANDTTAAIGSFNPNEYAELEYSIRVSTGAELSKQYCFRLYDTTGASALDGYDVYPELVIRGGLNVQKIIGSISGTLSQVETIPAPIADLERAFLLFDFSGGSSSDSEPRESMCTAYISSTSQVTVEKSSTSGTCTYAIYVVEAQDKEFIVRGRESISIEGAELSDTGTADTLNSIFDSSKAFISANMRSNADNSSEWNESYATVELTDTSTVTAERATNTGSDTTVVVRYEVVEWQYPGVTVQTKEKTLTNLSTSYQTDSIDTAVTTDRAFLLATFRHTDNGLAQTSVEAVLSDVDEVSFRRAGGTFDSVARWWVIEFPPNTVSVERGTGTDNSGSNYDINISIPTPVNTAKSFPVSFISNSGTGRAFPRGRSRSDLQSGTLLNFNGGYSGNTAYYSWQVLDTSGLIRPKLDQDSFRFYRNADAVQPETALASEESHTPYIQNSAVIRLRLGLSVSEAALPSEGHAFTLQYAAADDCTAASSWTGVGGISSESIWRGADNTSVADGTPITTSLLDGGGNALASYVEANNTLLNPNVVTSGSGGEWDFVLQNNGARQGARYCFRVIRNDGEILDTYSAYPQIVTQYAQPWTTF